MKNKDKLKYEIFKNKTSLLLFLSVIYMNSIWEILTKNLVTFKIQVQEETF